MSARYRQPLSLLRRGQSVWGRDKLPVSKGRVALDRQGGQNHVPKASTQAVTGLLACKSQLFLFVGALPKHK